MAADTQSAAGRRAPLVRLVGLSKRYVQKQPLTHTKFVVHAFEDVNLTIHHGTTLALVGESGAGKSTLAKCLALLEQPTAGEIWFEGENLLQLGRKQRFPVRRRIQLIFQDPTSALNPRMTAEEIIAEPLAIQAIGDKDSRSARTLELMEQVGLPAHSAQKRPLEFSGGQRQRLAIARALALAPRLLIFDEALSALDRCTQVQIVNLLLHLQLTCGVSILFITHDFAMAAHIADLLAVMEHGRIIESGEPNELVLHPRQERTRSLLAAFPRLHDASLEPRIC
jgi:ABC-type glutathione transport system ATPase component